MKHSLKKIAGLGRGAIVECEVIGEDTESAPCRSAN